MADQAPNVPARVIGLTGLPGCGKGEVTAALEALAAERGWRVAHLSFSDQIKEEARMRGVADAQFTREMLSDLGVEMRRAEGPGVLALRIARKIARWPDPKPDLFIAEALRHRGEAEALRGEFGGRFTLIAVDAEPREIARRILARGRPDESRSAMQSEDQAIALLERELNGHHTGLGPNVGDTMSLADTRVPNHGSLDELRRNVRGVFESIVGE